jgi:antitoxin (DNA-binding transcriptional repressor) of toxin-antitoxin stability system
MVIQVNIHEAKRRLSELLKAVEQGEIVTIARAGKPIAELKTLTASGRPRQIIGSYPGKISVPEDFDRYMQDEIEALFEDAPVDPRS